MCFVVLAAPVMSRFRCSQRCCRYVSPQQLTHRADSCVSVCATSPPRTVRAQRHLGYTPTFRGARDRPGPGRRDLKNGHSNHGRQRRARSRRGATVSSTFLRGRPAKKPGVVCSARNCSARAHALLACPERRPFFRASLVLAWLRCIPSPVLSRFAVRLQCGN